MKSYFQNKNLKYLLSIIFLLIAACEKNKQSPFDVNIIVPFIQELKISNYVIDTDTIRYNNQFSIEDTIVINNRITVKVNKNNISHTKSVIFSVMNQADNVIIEKGELIYNRTILDNEVSFDEYIGSTNFRIQRKVVGLFLLKVVAIDQNENYSNVLITSFELRRSGKPPIISNLNAPDTVTLPTSGQKVILFTLKAVDPNNDIKEVYFRSLDSSDPNRKFFLYDNGNLSLYGDSTANDGIYSILVALPYNMIAKAYRFEFEAKDYTELLSNKLQHTLIVVKSQ